ncbi:hypothetical protein PPH41_07740, partial [Burkholderia gladioli]|nr:hypothetical protein [Burkholderia gladioli]
MQTDIERRVTRKLMWRIIPFVMLLYFVSFLDRVNVGFAALTMNAALGLTPTAFGLGGGLFFIGYFLFEVPSNLILSKVGARRPRRARPHHAVGPAPEDLPGLRPIRQRAADAVQEAAEVELHRERNDPPHEIAGE